MIIERKESGLNKFLKAAQDMNKGTELQVGFFETAVYPTGEKVAYIATIHEFGSAEQGIPPRPFMRPAQQAHKLEWMTHLTDGFSAALAGKIEVADVLEQVGQLAAAQIAQAIEDVTSPPLKDATIKQKLNKYRNKSTVGQVNSPLKDTGLMIASVEYKVEKK